MIIIALPHPSNPRLKFLSRFPLNLEKRSKSLFWTKRSCRRGFLLPSVPLLLGLCSPAARRSIEILRPLPLLPPSLANSHFPFGSRFKRPSSETPSLSFPLDVFIVSFTCSHSMPWVCSYTLARLMQGLCQPLPGMEAARGQGHGYLVHLVPGIWGCSALTFKRKWK